MKSGCSRRAGEAVRLPAAPVTVIVGIGLFLSLIVAITFGPANLSFTKVWSILLHAANLGPDPGATPLETAMVVHLRLPRELLAAIAGAGLSICGVIMQSVLRNPLAEPYLLGVSSGASTGAVVVMVIGVTGTISSLVLSVGAFLGALLSFILMLFLAKLAVGTTDKIVLAGVAVTQGFAAVTSFIIMVGADANATRGVLYWLMGSLANVGWGEVAVNAIVLLLALIICLQMSGSLDAFTFGEAQASTLGVAVKRTRWVLLILSALLTATIVSTCGAIGFVGLVMPHVARLLVGSRHHALLPVSAVCGAVFLLWVDTIARASFAPLELPVGVITALVGVPVFAAILTRRRRAQ